MPSGVSDTVANAVLNALLGASAVSGLIGGASLDLDLLTTAPSDDNGTGAVSWGQGTTTVSTTSGTIWTGASGRMTASTPILSATNTSGSTITVVAFAWYHTGTYVGGGPLPDGTLDIDDGTAVNIVVTLASPSPS